MKAIRIEATGGPEVMTWTDVAKPAPGSNGILVELAAAGVNYIDTYHRGGLYPVPVPFTLGVEGAGIVKSTGKDVTNFKAGDRVCWTGVIGSYAQQAVVPAAQAVHVPDAVELELAAAVMLQGLTAHYLATSTFPLKARHKCLIHAGAGGVGQLLIQIAKMRGAEVFTTAGTPEKAEIAKAAGADHVILYRDENFGDAIERIAGPRPLDVIYDGVGADTFERGLEILRPRGMMVTFGNASGPVPPMSPLRLAQGGSLFLTRPTLADYTANREELEGRVGDLFNWIAGDKLIVNIGQKFPLSQARTAHEALEGRSTTGKVLLIAD